MAILGPGDSFGELSLLNSKKRAATIRCLDQPTEFLTLWKKGRAEKLIFIDYGDILGAKQKAEMK